jgi:DNA processing protein
MPDIPETVHDHLALALVPGLGPKLTAALLARFGSAAVARRATAAELRAIPHIGEKLAASLADALRTVEIEPELRLMYEHNVRAVPLGFPGYPARLAGVAGPPPLLYFRGDWSPADDNAIGIVGSRSCTSYGLRVAAQLARELARAGFTIVSGLARGIDAAAHRGAMEGGGRTVAALAGGLSRIYPPEHAPLADEITAGRGCLITETPMRMDPQAAMFPARNRIISGLARAVIVVEANVRSGALITARHAAEQGRDVYAVPGPVDSQASAGCLELLRTGARLVRGADDVIEDLRGLTTSSSKETGDRRQVAASNPSNRSVTQAPSVSEPPPPPQLAPPHQRVYDALAERRHADDLARSLELPVGELARLLMELELKKAVRRLPGNFYERR